uniref:Uncharacterized protein n=1 Tax=Arundo donax TaxID=35708 RepID=A0A0A9FP35_ARUDO
MIPTRGTPIAHPTFRIVHGWVGRSLLIKCVQLNCVCMHMQQIIANY